MIPVPALTIEYFHVHVYFCSSEERVCAEALREDAIKTLGGLVRVSRLVDQPIGPHPFPMFEMDFGAGDLLMVASFLMVARRGLRILIHPMTGNDLKDHTDHALWFGEVVPLKLEVF